MAGNEKDADEKAKQAVIDEKVAQLRTRIASAESLKEPLRHYAEAKRDKILFERELENTYGAREKQFAAEHKEREREATKRNGYPTYYSREKYQQMWHGQYATILSWSHQAQQKNVACTINETHSNVEKALRVWLEKEEKLVSTDA
jgi:hypothetical protein